MGAQGTATIDFGAFPGTSDASVAVTGQAAIGAASLVEAWIRPVATADHTDTEHMVETISVFAASIVAGTGFTIFGFNTSQLNEPSGRSAIQQALTRAGRGVQDNPPDVGGGKGTRLWGLFTVAWVWN